MPTSTHSVSGRCRRDDVGIVPYEYFFGSLKGDKASPIPISLRKVFKISKRGLKFQNPCATMEKKEGYSALESEIAVTRRVERRKANWKVRFF